MFLPFLYRLRAEGVPVGVDTWRALLDAMRLGLIGDLASLHAIGRAVVCRSESDFDAWDLAFAETFRGVTLDASLRGRLEAWLARAVERAADAERVDPSWDDDGLWDELRKRLAEQKEAHHGGNHWIGTGGTSPFGHGGRAARGIRIGGPGGGRGAIAVADARDWEAYRTDRALDTRDGQVALRALRRLVREGLWELDLDATIARTAAEAGEITLVERRARQNQVRLVLMLDVGGSMAPHAARVEALFTAVDREARIFRSFDVYCFHNVPTHHVWTEVETNTRRSVQDILLGLTLQHRVLYVGDASMAPYELFSEVGWGLDAALRTSGIEQLRRLKARAPASVWLNPDPSPWWDHPTVRAIGEVMPMFELTVDGLRAAVQRLRRPV
jgi:uncharacterized protein with von Willebrand factor type A (vWA) domain